MFERRVLAVKARMLLPDVGVTNPAFRCPRLGLGVTDPTAVANLPTGFSLPFDTTSTVLQAADSLLPWQQVVWFNPVCPSAELAIYTPASAVSGIDTINPGNNITGNLYVTDDTCLSVNYANHSVADAAGCPAETAFADPDDPSYPYIYVGISNGLWALITVTSGGGAFVSGSTYKMGLENWMNDSVIPITFTGTGTTTMTANVALLPDFYRFRPMPGTATWDSVLVNNQLSLKINAVATSTGTVPVKFGTFRFTPNEMIRKAQGLGSGPLPEALRTIGMRVTVSQNGTILYRGGDVLGLRVPKGTLFLQFVYPAVSGSTTTGVDVSATVIATAAYKRYAFETGISEAWIPQDSTDFIMSPTGSPGSVYRGASPALSVVSLNRLTGGQMMVINTTSAVSTGVERSAFINVATATEYTCNTSAVERAGPEFAPAVVNQALFELSSTEVATENPVHILKTLKQAASVSKRVATAVGRVAGPAAMATGAALAPIPAAQPAAAALVAGGAATSAIAELLGMF